ncbi:MAG TPA: multicopper oxidase domain-containing protein, partial [Microterricola sp.]
MPSRRELLRRVILGAAVTTAVLAVFVAWQGTLLGEYSVMEMGGSAQTHEGHEGHAGHAAPAGLPDAGAASVSVSTLTADPDRPADVRVELVARQERIDVPGGRPVDGYTVNGQSPGPVIRARQGELVEVVFINESVAAGATLHWHGIDVPNAADGVAGITQDVVPVGGRHVYRFVAADAGSYWYHSHQLSHEQVQRGLLGAIVIEPADSPASDAAVPDAATELIALLHLYGSQHTLNGRVADERVQAAPGQAVRVRVINTDQGTAAVWSAAPFRVVAIDGHEVNEPGEVIDRTLLIPAG